jgi:alpha-glucosidase (family GH31 glycosyl hydrolase)
LARGIPVAAVNIDSTWATHYNNFEPDPVKFPDFKGMVDQIHAQNIKVVIWATSMVNVENPDYDFCVKNDFLVKNSQGVARPIHWWHGEGSLFDYSNPEGLKWWHSKMDTVLDAGVDGFKTDGTDPYIVEYILAGGAYGYNNVSLTYRDYANYYYRDFFYYTREKRGTVGLIMARPVDCQVDKVGYVCTPYAPLDVMYSGWVGDDDGTFNGLRNAVKKFVYSAWDGYANFGADIGGYRGADGGSIKDVFIRWAQLGAFVPLMENGGGGTHSPWLYDEETTDIYRKFVNEHYRLGSYLHTTGTYAALNGKSSLTPLATRDETHPEKLPQPTTFSFLLGRDLLVHPVVAESQAINDKLYSPVRYTFPSEGDDVWLDWWAPTDARRMHKSGEAESEHLVPLDSYPVFVRKGAVVPLDGALDPASNEAADVTFTWFGPSMGGAGSADVVEMLAQGPGLEGSVSLDASGAFEGSISSHAHRKAGFAVVGVTRPENVQFSTLAAKCAHSYNPVTSTFKVMCDNLSYGIKVTASGMEPTI